MARFSGIAFGVLAHVVFFATLVPVYRFLHNDFAAAAPGPLWIDVVAALQFTIPHSLLLYPATRRKITVWLPSELYGCLFCLATCAGLWLQFILWRGSTLVVFEWPEPLKPIIRCSYLLSWVALIYCFYLNGLGYQTGVTPWWHWVRRSPLPRRTFIVNGAFRYLRHPAYLCFLGLVWLTPVITADRAVLIAVWTPYVFIGSYLKDERLVRLIGEPYRHYLATVPGYPFAWGALGRRPVELKPAVVNAGANPAAR